VSPSDLQQLGDVLRAQREAAGLSLRQAAERAQLIPSTLSRLETGQIEGPRPEHLQVLARTYGADVENFYALAGYLMPEGLPELRPYLRAKYGLPEQAANQIDEYFQALREKWQSRTNDQEDTRHDRGDTPH
jgi:transcriptional regulator with XRE-family HTH domain